MRRETISFMPKITFLLALFLFLGAATAGAYPRTEDDLIEMSCGDNGSALVLIAYDTIHGSTAEIAEYIGNTLCGRGLQADVCLAAHVEDISSYDAVVIGSAIYQFTWLEGAKAFLETFKKELSGIPTAYFIVGASMSEDTPANRESVKQAFIDPVLAEYPEIEPVSFGLFGGAVDFTANEYNLFERIVLRILGLILGYANSADWRDWEAIGSWSTELAGIL
jgi:menaquinone-dependent protoporphyrinogen oxidase